jgi:hypothetical protein
MKMSFKFRFDEGLNFEKKVIFYRKFENFQKYHFVNVKNYYPSMILQKESIYLYFVS